MRNWSGQIRWNPEIVHYPESEKEVQRIVQQAIHVNKKIRIIGTGHSFTPLCKTDEIMISLDRFQGLVEVDKENCKAIVKAGTKLKLLGDLLFEQDMAMENLGDIDSQSIAGTISTGTHGTGLQFGSTSTQVTALRWVNGKGELIECSETDNSNLFKAAQVSLGTLGIITQITLQCVPAYKLELWNRKEILTEVLQTLDQRNQDNRNFEFYWFPHTTSAWTKSSNIAIGKPDKIGVLNYFSEYVVENYAFKILCEWAKWFPAQNKTVAKISAASIPDVRKIFPSHKVYTTVRLVRFNEMEYSVPLAAHTDVLKEIIQCVNHKKFNVHFPIENRVVRGDDIYLSPAHGRDSAYIACHVYNKKDFRPFFKALEDIFKDFGGRPHWGKIHTLEVDDLRAAYPKFDIFLNHRKEQDPEGIFLTSYLRKLFGL